MLSCFQVYSKVIKVCVCVCVCVCVLGCFFIIGDYRILRLVPYAMQ